MVVLSDMLHEINRIAEKCIDPSHVP